MKSLGLTADVCLSAGMSSTLCQHSVLEKTSKQVSNPALCWAVSWCSASGGIALVPAQSAVNSQAAMQHYSVELSGRA